MKKLISVVLALQLGVLGPLSAASAQEQQFRGAKGPAEAPRETRFAALARGVSPEAKKALHQAAGLLETDTLLEWLGSDKTDSLFEETLSHLPTLAADSPLRDPDPFFLRHQKWVATAHRQASGAGATVRHPTLTRALYIDLPIHEIYQNSAFTLLAANEGTALMPADGGGLFVIRNADLEKAHAAAAPVPLFFLPLPTSAINPQGATWSGDVWAFEADGRNYLVLVDTAGSTIPVMFGDIEELIRAESLNFLLAQAYAAENAPPGSGPEALLPVAGSTAGFGMMYVAEPLSMNGGSGHSVSKLDFSGLLVSTAHAENQDPKAKLKEKLKRVAIIMGVAYGFAFAFKYTLLERYFDEKHEREEAKNPQPSSRLIRKLNDLSRSDGEKFREKFARDFLDVGNAYAHNLTAFVQFAPVMLGNSLQFFLDRYFSKFASAENSVIRKLLNWTVIYSAKANDRTPVSLKTLIYGFMFAGIDIVGTYLQLYQVIPAQGKWLAGHFPEIKEPVESRLNLNNPGTENIARNETVRSAAGLMTEAASTQSQRIQYQVRAVAEGTVMSEMRREGLDPLEPKNFANRDARVDAIVKGRLKELGAPGEEDFIYDVNSLHDSLLRSIGYGPSSVVDVPADKFWGATRAGLVIPALMSAAKAAQNYASKFPSDQSAVEAARVLTSDLQEMTLLRATLKQFREAPSAFLTVEGIKDLLRRVKSVRSSLVALTQEGDVLMNPEYLPEAWQQKVSRAGAQFAAQLYRRAMVAKMKNQPEILNGVSEDEHEQPFWNSTEVQQRLDGLVLGMAFERGEDPQQFGLKYPAEMHLLKSDLIADLEREDQQKSIPYKPKKMDFVERGQVARSVEFAHQEYARMNGTAFDAKGASSEDQRVWSELYQQAFLRAIGLHLPSEADLMRDADGAEIRTIIDRAREQAQLQSNQQLGKVEVVRYLAQLTPQERLQFSAENWVINFAPLYVNAVSRSQTISHLSLAQPGMLQRLRQTEWVRSSTLLTRLVRTFEAATLESQFSPGLGNAISRKVPFVYDFMLSNERMARAFLTRVTAGYLFNSVVWQVSPTPSQWLFGTLLGFTVAIPDQFLTRFFRFQGWKQMARWKVMAGFAVIYSWTTFEGYFAQMLLQEDFDRAFQYVTTHLSQVGQGVAIAAEPVVRPVVEACEKLLR